MKHTNWYSGSVQKVAQNHLQIKVMFRTGKKFRWPVSRSKVTENIKYTKVFCKILIPSAQNVKSTENFFTFDDNEYERSTKQ